jgi:hypothetical protein
MIEVIKKINGKKYSDMEGINSKMLFSHLLMT